MAQVPYRPEAQPLSGQGVSGPRVATPSEAFGVNVGQALSHMGQVSDQVGNEIFARATAMQQLQNEAEARDADAQYMIKAGELHANYSALQGMDAVRAQPKYSEDLRQAREQIRGTLSNPMAQKLFDSQSLSTMGRSIFNGAGHAATQLKQYNLNTAKAQLDLDAKAVDDNPQDDLLFQQKLNRTRQNAATISDLSGLEPNGPQEQDLYLKASSNLWASRIKGLARTDPMGAQKMLDDHKTELTQPDYDRVDNVVRQQSRAIGSVNIANEAIDWGKDENGDIVKPLKDIEDRALKQAEKLYPDDPILQKQAVAQARSAWNQYNYARKQEKYDNRQIVARGILDGARSVQELRADPRIAAAIDALPPSEQNKIPNQIASAHKQDNDYNFTRLKGMSNNDVQQFLETDIMSENLSNHQKDFLIDRQNKFKERASDDPRVTQKMGWLRNGAGTELQALGVFSRTKGNQEDYDHFTGTLQAALDTWQEAHKRPPTYKEFMDQIKPEVLRTIKTPGVLWGTNDTPIFQMPVPEKFALSLKEDLKARGAMEPTDEQIRQAYMRATFTKLYGGAGSAKEPKDQSRAPQVPVSK